ncbi:2-amino-4-hydroxy-6-hydroxymethyldihydropteridine diphosphokinase [Pseudohongiella spirulinae]|uniref:2-amino-4-hydroxy-6-hydroxymethyldihydropteridine pyrophosphokinase n=1 Tax=Pseudohongiella spirulinae TaxID=1249552 RepID=A0A0S2KH61_9GAMM|nr:2-amino-4-hydroxy-6-hydroxymethyldihydropteridine diphosphokinase [Pseudohongiella spirulinae]ALO47311.1 2-amino-4-hydroxy-6-hydroxymethyldihydropteridine pyrophosphokinase [Pseudohongiella spirulinae]
MSCRPAIIDNWLAACGEKPSILASVALIALGSNLESEHGSPVEAVKSAFASLQELSNKPVLYSSIISSQPLECPPGSPDFANAVLLLIPREGETARSLLACLHQIEAQFGRKRSGLVNEPRVLDLDLIAFGQQTSSDKNLLLPHPRAARREFVLQPLCELWPQYSFPDGSGTAQILLNRLRAA